MQQAILTPAQLLSERRAAAGLSANALARRAGVPASTVTRVESGDVDPTITMLQRLIAATGRDLELRAVSTPDEPTLAAVVESTAHARDDREAPSDISWTWLRGFVDWAEAHPDRIPSAIHRPPHRTGVPLLDNVIAAIAESLAGAVGQTAPRWCSTVQPLASPYETPGTPTMRARTRAETLPPFAERSVFISASNLWHQR